MLSAEDISARTARAVAAATKAGRDLGLRVEEPRVLYDVFSVIVHLAPEPVIVRVPTVLPPYYDEVPEVQTAQQRAELSVTRWLADRGLPVVPPSPLVPVEPVERDGFSMTFWQLVDELPDHEPDYVARTARAAELHAALRAYPGELGFWVPFGTYIPSGLAALEGRPDLLDSADLLRAQREWALIEPLVTSPQAFRSRFPDVDLQPIHGDAPFHNMITTADGELWSDFELVTLGPVESDVAMAGAEAVAAYDAAAAQLGLRALDGEVLRLMEAAGDLSIVACLAMAPQLPMLLDGLRVPLDQWRARPELTVF